MGPKPSQPQSGELFRPRLDEQINMQHPLVRLATMMDWAARVRHQTPQVVDLLEAAA